VTPNRNLEKLERVY